MTTNNHPAHAPLTSRRLHQMRDILSKAAAQRDGGDIGYAMSDAVKMIDEVLAGLDSNPVVIDERASFNAWNNEDNLPIAGVGAKNAAWLAWQARAKFDVKPAPVVPDNRAITQHFDSIALETAREIMCDVNRRDEFPGGEVQLLSRVQCRVDEACRAAMLQGKSEPVSEPYKLTATLIKAMRSAIDQLDRRAGKVERGYPQHSHSVSGVWDQSNGRIANEPCSVCALWDEMREYLMAAPKQDDAETSSNIDNA